jgi:hypothetical protein
MVPLEMRKLGRKAIKTDSRTLRLARYLTKALPAPPASINYLGKVTNFGMMLNDNLGDCTIAALGHAVQVWTMNAGGEITLPDSTILTGYEDFCGYDPSDPSTDQGGVILDVLNDFKSQGLGAYSIDGFASVSIRNTRELKQAITLFGCVDIGINLPISAQNQTTVWDVVPDDGTGNTVPGSWGGHSISVCAFGGTSKFLTSVSGITWGSPIEITPAFWFKYVDEAYAMLSPAWLTAAGAPNGFNLAQLEADLAAIR